MSRKTIAWIAISGLFVKALWILHPDYDVPWQQLELIKKFPLSDIEITDITYVSMICDKSAMLIWIFCLGMLMPQYWRAFSVWFTIQALQFGEFFLNYNETSIYLYGVPINLSFAKLVLPACVLLYEQIWKDK